MKHSPRWIARLRHIAWVLFMLLLVAGSVWTGCWFLVGWLFPSWGDWLHGLAALWASFMVLFAGSAIFGRAMGERRNHMFTPFNDAFRRIAAGDYSVQVPVKDERGDLTPFHTMAENLNAMAGSLAKVEDLRRQFVADVSHEFQSPLTSILGFAQALKTNLKDETRQHYLSIIEAEARRLSRLADTLLKLNALEDREGPPDPTPFRLDVQLRRVLVTLEPQWAVKRLEVEAQLDEAEVTGNAELWTQVWTNLLHNAVKFTPAEGRIIVRMTAAPLVVEVEDTGIGLTEEESARVFERFYKAESARSHTDGSGSGLGLALVHRIVTLHGAKIEALSRGPGLGAMLRVSFPPLP